MILKQKQRWKKGKFAAIQNIFEKFNNNCGKSIIPDDLLSTDETLVQTIQPK